VLTPQQRLLYERAFDEGMGAFGRNDKHNPYPPGSPSATAWLAGWNSAADAAWDAWKEAL
jgi:ribosome modulation factor